MILDLYAKQHEQLWVWKFPTLFANNLELQWGGKIRCWPKSRLYGVTWRILFLCKRNASYRDVRAEKS